MDCEVLIVGAGIHGAAVAQAAAAAGYRTLLLEQYAQPAQGTSSKSSKLIHGGLRYLESGQFRLVRECLVERARLLHNAPHLVELKPFCIPVYADTQRRAWQIRAGLGLYALLGGKRFATLPRAQWARLDGLRTAGLQTVFRYYDAQTDDAALTRAVCASAVSLGAEIRYRHSFAQARCDKHGCRVRYQSQDNSGELHTAVLVNAAGAWVNELLQHVEPAPTRLDIDMVQGTHIVMRGRLQQGLRFLSALIAEADGIDYLVFFDQQERLNDWAEDDVPCQQLPGHVLVEMTPDKLYWAMNIGTEYNKQFAPDEIAWLKDVVARCKEEGLQ